MNPSVTRRSFLKKSIKCAQASLAAPFIIPHSAFSSQNNILPSEKITLGFIGVGSHGTGVNLRNFLGQPDAKVLAVCDVDEERMGRAKNIVDEKYDNKDCSVYSDFRDLLALKDIDAVVISTPDHWHVPLSVYAARAGKDICCEKPTLTIQEGQQLCDVIKKYQRIFQTSTEDRSVFVYHRMAELVRNGRIGKLKSIHVDLWQGHGILGDYGKNDRPQPVPKGFNYDLWLGPAPEAPYTPGRCHYNFRWIMEYSGGMLTDWGAHLLDTAQWGNDTELTGPVSIDGKGVFPKDGLYDTATDYNIEYIYKNGVKLIVKSGGCGIRFIGSDGWVGNTGWRGPLEASSQQILHSYIGPEETHLYTCKGGEHRNFLDCVKSRKQPYFPVEIGHRCCSLLHLGNISMILNKKLEWDPDRQLFPNDPEANRYLSRPRRSPWHL